MRIAFPSEDEVAAKDFIGFAALSRTLFPPLCSRIVLKTTLTAGGTPRQRRMERRPPADLLPFVARNHARQAKPDRALAPLSMLATLAPPAANAAWRGGGEERKKRFAERSLRAALPHEGASGPAVGTCCLSPVWNTGCLCGNEHCRPCRSKGMRRAQRRQHYPAAEPPEVRD